MSQKTKITEIRENYTVNRPTKDASGERVYEEKNFIRYKEIPYVTGWARFAHYILDIVFYYVFALILGADCFITVSTGR